MLAASLAVTSISATPARAELNDIEKLIFGATTLFILGAAIEAEKRDNKKSKKHKKHSSKKSGKKHAKAPLPRFCLRTVRSYQGDRRLFGQRCLQNNYRQVNALPGRCKTFVQGPRGTRIGYRPRCLKNAGYRVRG
ncbi:hypothetical protein [Primorskyibacter sp. S187A]|uniref:hypothetical protein n=1 Tax=Primorskyibacter sp. S187A TaxID=3415130 RepID=UPI003C7C86AE